jgi:preprotein translocase subunit SecA
VAHTVYHVRKKEEPKQAPSIMVKAGVGSRGDIKPMAGGKKIGRNDPCPCGSGKKYKHCHGK